MKTAISLPDKVFLEADRLAKKLKKSRSQLYREAVQEFVVRHDPDAVMEAYSRWADEEEAHPDPILREVARRVLGRTEWK